VWGVWGDGGVWGVRGSVGSKRDFLKCLNHYPLNH
jgi:hypothetical protein